MNNSVSRHAFFHQSDETRVVSKRLIPRLAEMKESPCVFTERATELEGIRQRRILGGQQDLGTEDVRREVAEWQPKGRVGSGKRLVDA